ncbi:hypothetical protein H4S02_003978 [Coemansia sp. RSA 2611]|nr:hypothetical protein H4S02_003978 [Coemansia sp. RSA 2611]
MLTARTPAGACSLASCSRRAYSLGAFDKELAGVTDVSWKSGQKHAQGKRASATISSFHNKLPPTGGSNSGLYSHLRVMARDSDLYRVITEQPISRKGVPFNPWTLLLELLDDPRIIYSGGPKAGQILLDAVSWMGWVTPQNISTRRTELVYALRASNCIKVYQRLMLPTCQSNVELTPAQSIQFQQIQWPRHIAEKYAELLSVPSIASQDSEPAVSWAYTWLTINLCMLELKAAYTKNRVIFNHRLDTRRRLRQVVQDAVAYAPGNPTRIIGPYVEEQILGRYFADASTLKAAVGSAWQLQITRHCSGCLVA